MCAAEASDPFAGEGSLSSRLTRSTSSAPTAPHPDDEPTTKSTFSASVTRSNLTLSPSRSHTFIIGLYVPVPTACRPSGVTRIFTAAEGNVKSWMSSSWPSWCCVRWRLRAPVCGLRVERGLMVSHEGREEDEVEEGPLVVKILGNDMVAAALCRLRLLGLVIQCCQEAPAHPRSSSPRDYTMCGYRNKTDGRSKNQHISGSDAVVAG